MKDATNDETRPLAPWELHDLKLEIYLQEKCRREEQGLPPLPSSEKVRAFEPEFSDMMMNQVRKILHKREGLPPDFLDDPCAGCDCEAQCQDIEVTRWTPEIQATLEPLLSIPRTETPTPPENSNG